MRLWQYALAATVLMMWVASANAAVPSSTPTLQPPEEQPSRLDADAGKGAPPGARARQPALDRSQRPGRSAGAARQGPRACADRPESARERGDAAQPRRLLRGRFSCPAPWCPLGLHSGRGPGFGAGRGAGLGAGRRPLAAMRRNLADELGARPKAGLGLGRGAALRERLRAWSQPGRQPGWRGERAMPPGPSRLDRAPAEMRRGRQPADESRVTERGRGQAQGDQLRTRERLRDEIRELRERLRGIERELETEQ